MITPIKKIHFIWVNKYDYDDSRVTIPHKYRVNIENWKKLHPEWEITVWNSDAINQMIMQCESLKIAETYFNYKNFICKVDFAKLLILYYEGGLYMDVDIFCNKNIDPLLESITESLTLVKEPNENVKNYKGFGYNMDKFVISNAWIYSEKNNKQLLKLIGYMVNFANREKENILLATGPPIFNIFYTQDNNNDIKLLDAKGILTDEKDGYSYTTFDNSWCTSKIWNDILFNNFYFYPTFNISGYPFRKTSVNNIIDQINQGSRMLSFDTDGDAKIAIPSLSMLSSFYNNEFEGLFIRKSYFTRNIDIPKIIHQIWIGPLPVPKSFTDTWKEKNPDYNYILWNEDTLKEEIPEAFADSLYLKAYDFPGKTDILRLYLLYKLGGIYMDCDMKCLKPFTNSFLHHNFFLTFSSELTKNNMINNGMIGCVKECPIIKIMLKEIHERHDASNGTLENIYITGPGFTTGFVARHQELDMFIYPSYYFSKNLLDNNKPRENTFLTTQCYADHVGRFDSEYICELENIISSKNDLGYLLNKNNLLGIGAEIGVLRGYSSRRLLKKWKGQNLYMIDCWEQQKNDLYIDSNNHSDEVNIVNMEVSKIMVRDFINRYTIIKGYSKPESEKIRDNSLDFVYIDARHDYDGVMEDLESWYPKVKQGGLVSGDDIIEDTELEYVKQFGKFEVKRALLDFMDKHKIDRKIYYTKERVFKMFYFFK